MITRVGAVVAVVAFLGAIIALNLGAWWSWRDARFFDTRGRHVVAAVIDESSSAAPRKAEQHWLTVRFEVDGTVIEGRRSVDANTHLIATIDDIAGVVYDPADPNSFDIEGNERGATVRALAVIVDLVLAGALVAVVHTANRSIEADTA